MHVNRIGFSQVNQLFYGFINKNDADQRGKGFLCETRDVADQWAGICGNQNDAEKRCPQTDAGSQREVWKVMVSGVNQETNI